MSLRLARFKERWIARDDEAGYCAMLSESDAAALAADFHKGEELRLRILASSVRDIAHSSYDFARPRTYGYDEVP